MWRSQGGKCDRPQLIFPKRMSVVRSNSSVSVSITWRPLKLFTIPAMPLNLYHYTITITITMPHPETENIRHEKNNTTMLGALTSHSQVLSRQFKHLAEKGNKSSNSSNSYCAATGENTIL